LFHGISQDYLTKEAPQHFAREAEVFLRDKMMAGRIRPPAQALLA